MTNNSGLTKYTKKKNLKELARYRDDVLRPHPVLRSFFIEMTSACNEHCRHCGSRCGDSKEENALSTEEIKALLDQIKEDFDISNLRLNITGGEPLLRKDFFEIMNYANFLGYRWGMTSNGTLITPEVAGKLHEAGMQTVSISLDGLEKTHDWFRESEGSYKKTLEGIHNLINEGGFNHIQITTVVHAQNYDELEDMYATFSTIGVRSWRVINIEPIGRAKDDPKLLLTNAQLRGMFDFIEKHRFKGPMEVTYGCSHYLGIEHEKESRPWYFICNAGVYTASVMYNGDVTACLDIERRPELIQGNIRKTPFRQIWENGFKIYRSDYRKCGKCADCKEYEFCKGDSFHTWNFDDMEPYICMRDVLKGKIK